ncbi:arylformamidase [Salinithrix halophila]|uniref:Kynurenine formamidase n=1 Tax=Salinithrix halophila TaxID=1485204 RepID=A0ABV8JJ62_9BACL
MTTWIDISQPLREGMAVWPGDTPFSYQSVLTKAQSGSVNVGSLTMSAHSGTHVDAPFHFDNQGKGILELDLDPYVGPARVVSLPPGTESIGPASLEKEELAGVERLLLRTGVWTDRCTFPERIPPVEPELALWLAERGIRLLGLDLPSVDPLDSKELPAHHALARHGVHILEGAVLDDVEPGNYELYAFPLPLKGADGSPVRAVLRKVNS